MPCQLAVVVGGSALLAAATAFIHREWAVLVSVLAGLMMAGYLVEVVSIDSKLGNALPISLAVQLFYFVLGLALFGLAGFLWMREYRGQRFHLRRHATHD